MIVYSLNKDKTTKKTIIINESQYNKLKESQKKKLGKKVIKITESQFERLIEGIEYDYNKDTNKVDARITKDMSDKGNETADTRVFGSKKDVLYGDGTSNRASLNDKFNSGQALINAYLTLYNWVDSGRQGELRIDRTSLNTISYNKIIEKVNNLGDEELKAWAKKQLNLAHFQNDEDIAKYREVSNSTKNKVMRYKIGVVPNTDIEYIALFSIDDFNFSDVLKHGKMRQNPGTDTLLGINKSERETDEYGNLKQLDMTYDNGKVEEPDIAQNFSLKDVKPMHFKQQYGYGGEGYTSINALLDKSVMYANEALKEQGFRPTLIISVPSSSKFNEYYCTNLSNKLGIPYVKDFFQRNTLNVRLEDGHDINELKKNGIDDGSIQRFVTSVKRIAKSEISYLIGQPITKFVESKASELNNISKVKYSREKWQFGEIKNALVKNIYLMINHKDNISEFLTNYNVSALRPMYAFNDAEKVESYKEGCEKLGLKWDDKWATNKTIYWDTIKKTYGNATAAKIKKYGDSQYDASSINKNRKEQLEKYITPFLQKHAKEIENVLKEVSTIQDKCSKQITEVGWKPSFGIKRFKVTELPKLTRNYLHKCYVVADKNLNQNLEIFKRYSNNNILLFDEDINSGASLRQCIEAMFERLPSNWNHNQLLCLLNAISKGGM